MEEHTYFLKAMDWAAAGTYYDEARNAFPLRGSVRILREPEWTLNGLLEVRSDPPVRFTNDYRIRQAASPLTLEWTSFNPALGPLEGSFEFVGRSILSAYRSQDGAYSGTEVLTLREDGSYYNAGAAFWGGRRLSSWEAVLTPV